LKEASYYVFLPWRGYISKCDLMFCSKY
jgi:hypothetical protein